MRAATAFGMNSARLENEGCVNVRRGFGSKHRLQVYLSAKALKSCQRHGEAAHDPGQKGQLVPVTARLSHWRVQYPSLENTTTLLEHEGGELPTVFGSSEEDPCGEGRFFGEVCGSTDAVEKQWGPPSHCLGI
ncbi:hypothetical protein HPB47_025693 [Ixodes persulcatus]|uniref:Uncharacterized protein n=1 Tax=Ixodes persulcatus TaxID=34615 RepID=A0AC60Q168_IXOPE|nr:hypothetical protein HPB47_025693 [Ixodes persulcatus]